MNNQKHLSIILNIDYKCWSALCPYVDQILEELEELMASKETFPNEIKNKIFWFFRNYFSDCKNQLSKSQADKLSKIIEIILEKDVCLLNLHDTDLSILEDMLIVLERIVYLYPDLKVNVIIFNPLIKAASSKKDLNVTKNAGAFIPALLSCFKAYLASEEITQSIELIHLTQALQELFTKQLVWNKNDPVAMLVHGLLFLKDLRCKYKENLEIRSIIDYYAVKLCDLAIHDIPKNYPYYSIKYIQEDIGAAYVKYLEKKCWNGFNGLYITLSPEDILPKVKLYTLLGDSNLPDVTIKINYKELSAEKNKNMEDLINELYAELKEFLNSLKMKSLKLDKIQIQLNLFNDQKQFERYGYLVWNVDSSGGGISMPGINNQPTTSFIYQIEQGFENLKHELTHAFMDNILGCFYTECLSGAFIEGLADFFDKGPSNRYKLIQMQRSLLREPLKALPNIVTLNEGGSIVYLYGYFLIAYLIEEKLTLLSKILTKVQSKNKSGAVKIIEQFALDSDADFSQWMQNQLSQLVEFLFKAIRDQDRGNVNQLLAGMNNQQVNVQESSSNKDTPLHVAIEIWLKQKNHEDKGIALSIIWSLLLKGAELKNMKNLKNKSPFDLIEDIPNRELIEKYAKDAKHYIDLQNISYTEKITESVIC